LKILVACEFSGIVRDAFRRRGHDATSCDLLPTEAPGPHIQGDALALLNQHWDLLIAHPPCTFLTNSQLWCYYHPDDKALPFSQRRPHPKWPKREREREEAVAFFMAFINAPVPKICVENPIGWMNTHFRKPNQILQPWYFGHPEQKSTCIWTKNLPSLYCTNILSLPESGYWENQTPSGQNNLSPSESRWKERSKTYLGIAEAMANQWG
jgi:hypothetical protein